MGWKRRVVNPSSKNQSDDLYTETMATVTDESEAIPTTISLTTSLLSSQSWAGEVAIPTTAAIQSSLPFLETEEISKPPVLLGRQSKDEFVIFLDPLPPLLPASHSSEQQRDSNDEQSLVAGKRNSPNRSVNNFLEIFKDLRKKFPRLEAVFQCASDVDYYSDDDENNTLDEDDMMQMRRLGSWSTLETLGTYATIRSASDNAFSSSKARSTCTTFVDTDQHVTDLDLALMEKRYRSKSRSTRANTPAAVPPGIMQKKKRSVRFEYPPVSSLRQCPRVDSSDLPTLFFTAEELDVYEHDRESTFIADDIEIVAISNPHPASFRTDESTTDQLFHHEPPSSSSDSLAESDASLNREPSLLRADSKIGFGNLISYSRSFIRKKKVGKEDSSSSCESRKTMESTVKISPRPEQSTGILSPSTSRASKTDPQKERLIQSVQIFLRERSMG